MTTSAFKLLCQSCGLSMREATAFLKVPQDTAKNWWLGRRTCPSTALTELRRLYARIDNAAWQLIAAIQESAGRNGWPQQTELGISADDHEAQTLGWPWVGAHEAVVRIILENLPPDKIGSVIIVPRGTTAATAAAAEAHEQ